MLALANGVPRTLSIDSFVREWTKHQIDVIVRRTKFRLRKAEEQIHIFRGYLKALDALDEVIALIRRSPDVDEARTGLMDLLEIDEIQANAILAMQLRRLAALERQKIIEEHDRLQALIEEYTAILADPQRQRDIVSEELAEIVDRFGDDRRTEILPFAGDMALIPMFLGYVLFGRGLATVPASTATTVTLTEPAVATLLAVVVVGERLGPLGWAGLLVLAAVLALLALAPPAAAPRPVGVGTSGPAVARCRRY